MDKILRYLFGHKCYVCKKIIQKGNDAGEMATSPSTSKGHICVDCIIKPENKWTNDILTREEYFKCEGKPESRKEWNIKRAELGYPSMSKLKWFLYHGLD